MSRLLAITTFLTLLLLTGCSSRASSPDEEAPDPDMSWREELHEGGRLLVVPEPFVVFGDVRVGDQAKLPVSLRNIGEEVLVIRSVGIQEKPDARGDELAIEVGWEGDLELSPGEHRELDVVWSPQDTEPDRAILTFHSSDSTLPYGKVLEVRSPRLYPNLSTERQVVMPSHDGMSFQTWAVHELHNDGHAPLQLTNVYLSHEPQWNFRLSLATPGRLEQPNFDQPLRGWEERLLEPGESLFLRVTHIVRAGKSAWADLNIESNDPGERLIVTRFHFFGARICYRVSSGEPLVEQDATFRLDLREKLIGRDAVVPLILENCSEDIGLSLIAREDMIDPQVFSVQGLPGTPSRDFPYVIPPQGSLSMEVYFRPREEVRYESGFVLSTLNPSVPSIAIELEGRGTMNPCPRAQAGAKLAESEDMLTQSLETLPRKTIQLDGTSSFSPSSGSITHRWNLFRVPPDSQTQLEPVNSDSTPLLFLDFWGHYQVFLGVEDGLGQRSCEPAVINIEALPDQDLAVRLEWSPVEATNRTHLANLDLHYRLEEGDWGQTPSDIWTGHPTADWGIPDNTADDPELARESQEYPGLEVVLHDNPLSTQTYRIGAHYRQDRGVGAVRARVLVFQGGVLVWELERTLSEEGDFWEIATIEWASQDISELDEVRRDVF